MRAGPGPAEERAAPSRPLDVARFRRKQATFAAHRLSLEEAEGFFRLAVPLIGGTLAPFDVVTDKGETYTAFEVTLPPTWAKAGARKLRLLFWPPACSDDETLDDAVLFIGPGHRLFEALLDAVLTECAPDLNQGAVFLDRQPAAPSP
jgi:hypothetical protein